MRVQFSAGADRLTWAFPKLSPQLKKCAAYVLEHPSEVATLSMREVAARAGVPPSTMARLARAVGFGAYNEFRDIYRNSINDLSIGRSRRAGQLQVAMARPTSTIPSTPSSRPRSSMSARCSTRSTGRCSNGWPGC